MDYFRKGSPERKAVVRYLAEELVTIAEIIEQASASQCRPQPKERLRRCFPEMFQEAAGIAIKKFRRRK